MGTPLGGTPTGGLSRNPSSAAGLSRNPSSAAGLSRNRGSPPLSRNTSASGSGGSVNGAGVGAGAGAGGLPPVRGLSVRRPGTGGSVQSQAPPRLPIVPASGEPPMSSQRSSPGERPRERGQEREPPRSRSRGDRDRDAPRITDFYDDYLGAYEDPAPPLPDSVAAWAAKTKGGSPTLHPRSRSGSVAGTRPGERGFDRGYDQRYEERPRAPPSSYGGSSGMGLRRKMSRRPTRGYEDEEEGYVSGDYSDAPFELSKIRVKVCIFTLFGALTCLFMF